MFNLFDRITNRKRVRMLEYALEARMQQLYKLNEELSQLKQVLRETVAENVKLRREVRALEQKFLTPD